MKRQDSEKIKLKAAYREAFKAYEGLKEAAKKAELRLNSVEQERWKISQNLETTKKRIAESDRIFMNLQDDAGSSLEKEKRLRETVAQKEAELAALEAEMEQDDTGSAEYIEVIRGAGQAGPGQRGHPLPGAADGHDPQPDRDLRRPGEKGGERDPGLP